MRFYEFASANDKLELWRVIDKSVWQELDKQAPVKQAQRGTKPIRPKNRAPTKAEFRHRGTQIASAGTRDAVDPSAKAAEQLQQAQQQQILRAQQLQLQRQQAMIDRPPLVSNGAAENDGT